MAGSRGLAPSVLKLAGGYWSGPTRQQAWLLKVAIIVLVVANVAGQYGVNRFFFNALEQHQSNIVLSAFGCLPC